jgi:hypothetical protein
MPPEGAAAPGVLFLLDRVGEAHRGVVLQPLTEPVKRRIVAPVEDLVELVPPRDADEVRVGQRPAIAWPAPTGWSGVKVSA